MKEATRKVIEDIESGETPGVPVPEVMVHRDVYLALRNYGMPYREVLMFNGVQIVPDPGSS